MKKFNITDIDLEEVSFVGKGANQGAHVVLMKRLEKAETKREMGEDFPASAFAYVPDPGKPSTWKLRLWDSIAEKETRSQVGAAVAALGPGFRGNKVQIPSEDLSGVKQKVLAAWLRVNEDKKREDAPTILKSEGVTMKTKEQLQKELDDLTASQEALTVAKADLQKEHDKLVADNAALVKERDDLKKSADGKKADGISKEGLPEAVVKHLEKQDADIAAQAELIAKMADETLEKSWIAKAQDVLLVGEATEVGTLLKSVAETSQETAEGIMTLLKAANARIEKGNLFKVAGTDGESETDGALGELNKKAQEVAKAKSITFEKAFAEVYKTEHALRKQYLTER